MILDTQLQRAFYTLNDASEYAAKAMGRMDIARILHVGVLVLTAAKHLAAGDNESAYTMLHSVAKQLNEILDE